MLEPRREAPIRSIGWFFRFPFKAGKLNGQAALEVFSTEEADYGGVMAVTSTAAVGKGRSLPTAVDQRVYYRVIW